MNPAIRLLVVVIVAAAIIALLYAILTMFFPSEDAVDLLKRKLSVAEIETGQAISEEIIFGAASYVPASIMDTRSRSVAFECNNPEICCAKSLWGEKCHADIEWDERSIKFRANTPVLTSVRCSYEHDIYNCRVYFGELPAQVKLVKVEAEDSIDLLQSSNFHVAVFAKNVGEKEIYFGSIELEFYGIAVENGIEEEYLIASKSTHEMFTGLKPGAETSSEFNSQIEWPGTYRIKVNVKGDNAGFDYRKLSLNAFGEQSNCAVDLGRGENGTEDIGSKRFFYCKGCVHDYECEEVWESVVGEDLEAGDSSFAYKIIS